MQRAYVGVTDPGWAPFLRARPHLDEVNFWKPSTVGFGALTRGQPFLFKARGHGSRLIGGDFFTEYRRLRVSEAWRFFGEGNGVASHDELRTKIAAYRARNRSLGNEPDPFIGSIMLNGVFFVDDDVALPPPPDWSPNLVSGKTFELTTGSYVEHAFTRLLTLSGIRSLDTHGLPEIIPGPVFRENPQLVLARAGQGAFRAAVTAAYERRCAITGSHIVPVLEAAHIRPVADDGQNRVDNGILLRSDVHTLYDQGYIGIDTKHRLHVSSRLREDFGNGKEFYALAGSTIALPAHRRDWPDSEAATWHMDTKFLASR